MKTFKSIFADHLASYVKLRRNMGFKFEVQADILLKFDLYVFEQEHKGQLTQELAMDFATVKPHISKNEIARRYHVIRHFSDYLAAFEPGTPKLLNKELRYGNRRPPAYIYTEKELTSLLYEARHISRNNLLRGITLHAMVGLAASTGLRIGEVVRLDQADVDLDTGILVIRQTKFKKDRLVPVHPTTLEVLRKYAAVRDAKFLECKGQAFFINMWRRRFAKQTLQLAFWELAFRAGIRGAKGKGPSFHDLRHTFAVRRLVTWYREGKDVQAMLPALATYLGHVHYSDTAYYLTATAELLGLAADRFQKSLQQEGRCS